MGSPIDKRIVARALETIDWEHARLRFVADVFGSALPDQWQARARTFESARPQRSDFTGCASPAELEALDARCASTAAACRLHAALLRGDDLLDARFADDIGLYLNSRPNRVRGLAA